MGKWFGKVGYGITKEVEPGVYVPEIIEQEHYGDITTSRRRYQNSNNINDELVLVNTISILANPFMIENYSNIRYVEIIGSKWKVTEIEPQYPRFILTTGGVYNGDTPGTTV